MTANLRLNINEPAFIEISENGYVVAKFHNMKQTLHILTYYLETHPDGAEKLRSFISKMLQVPWVYISVSPEYDLDNLPI